MAAKRTRSPDALSVAGRKPEPPHLLSLISDVRSADLRLVDGPRTVRMVAETFAGAVMEPLASFPPADSLPEKEPPRGSAVARIAALEVGQLTPIHIFRPREAIKSVQRYLPHAEYRSERVTDSLFLIERVR